MSDQKNLILAIIASMAILFGFQYFYEMPRAEKARQLEAQRQEAIRQANPNATVTAPPRAPGDAPPIPVPGGAGTAAETAASRDTLLAQTRRVRIEGRRVHGSINLTGGRLDDLTLIDYRVGLDPKSPEIVLLSPAGAPGGYYAEYGWSSGGGVPVKLPDGTSEWQAAAGSLRGGEAVTLSWDNGEGLVFRRTFALDDNYLFTVTQAVENKGGQPVTLYPYALIVRSGTPKTDGMYVLHEGPLGVFRDSLDKDGTLKEISYSDLVGEKPVEQQSLGGWIGFTDKYWLTALIPANDAPVKARFSHTQRVTDRYQADVLGTEGVAIPVGGSGQSVMRLFAGAKQVGLIDGYHERLAIPRFDRAIDWGWFPFLTKPMFAGLDYFHKLLGNMGLAILMLTIVIKTLFLPLAWKSYVSMSAMKELQPKMVELREKYGEDRAKLSQEMMSLYKKEKVNPAAGCFPILLQIPVFFALYKVLYISIEMRHAPFYGWVRDLSAPDPTTWINLFGLLPFEVPNLGPLQIISLGVWPIFMGITMWLQMRMNPTPPDPVQAKIFAFMPIIFTFMMGSFAAGLVIYWSWNNLLSVAQQWFIMRRMKAQKAKAKAKAA
jgi:YidC/Oxa1 family membrane protein insertase